MVGRRTAAGRTVARRVHRTARDDPAAEAAPSRHRADVRRCSRADPVDCVPLDGIAHVVLRAGVERGVGRIRRRVGALSRRGRLVGVAAPSGRDARPRRRGDAPRVRRVVRRVPVMEHLEPGVGPARRRRGSAGGSGARGVRTARLRADDADRPATARADRRVAEHLQRAFGLLLVVFAIWFVFYRLFMA